MGSGSGSHDSDDDYGDRNRGADDASPPEDSQASSLEDYLKGDDPNDSDDSDEQTDLAAIEPPDEGDEGTSPDINDDAVAAAADAVQDGRGHHDRPNAPVDETDLPAHAGAPEVAAGVTDVLDDGTDRFHEVRNAIIRADDRQQAIRIAREEFGPERFQRALREAHRVTNQRTRFEPVDDVGRLVPGQDILFVDGRGMPSPGVVTEVSSDGLVAYDRDNRPLEGRFRGSNDVVEVLADPDKTGEVTTYVSEGGRFGMASDRTVLRDPNQFATLVETPPEAGITGGNNTASEMLVANFNDGSRAFLTPTRAYRSSMFTNHFIPNTTDEAIRNNVEGAKVIRAFGGHSCRVEVVNDEAIRTGGDAEYIVREGIDGPTLSDYGGGSPHQIPDHVAESVADSCSAGYFAGNTDLHLKNIVVAENGTAYVIDHDARETGIKPTSVVPQTISYDTGKMENMIINRTVEQTEAYVRGDIDLPAEVGAHTRQTVVKQIQNVCQDARTRGKLFTEYESKPAHTYDLARHLSSSDSDLSLGGTVDYVNTDFRLRHGELVDTDGSTAVVAPADGEDTVKIDEAQLLGPSPR